MVSTWIACKLAAGDTPQQDPRADGLTARR